MEVTIISSLKSLDNRSLRENVCITDFLKNIETDSWLITQHDIDSHDFPRGQNAYYSPPHPIKKKKCLSLHPEPQQFCLIKVTKTSINV